MAFMGIMAKYFLAGFIGFLIGVVLSCFLLAKKNLDKAHAIEDSIEASFKSAKKNYKSMTGKMKEHILKIRSRLRNWKNFRNSTAKNKQKRPLNQSAVFCFD